MRIHDAKELAAKAAEATRLLAALANVNRLAILCQLVEGERPVGALVEAVGLSQSAFSQHLAKLRGAGIVATRRNAQTVYYRLASKAAGSVMTTLAEDPSPTPARKASNKQEKVRCRSKPSIRFR